MSCKYLHIVSSFTVNSTNNTVTLNFSNPITSLTDEEKFCFKIPCGVTSVTGIDNYTVYISYNDTTLPLWDKYGNPATFEELSKNRCYKGFYGATVPHVISQLPVTYNCRCGCVL